MALSVASALDAPDFSAAMWWLSDLSAKCPVCLWLVVGPRRDADVIDVLAEVRFTFSSLIPRLGPVKNREPICGMLAEHS
ncbi:MAG: hypothetical protein AB7O38_12510 [Pirellulaceae bacterium]